jgi:prolyl-tRNA synthetase
MRMLDVYADFAENYMAMPVIKGEKTALERFPGAVSTYCIEAMMQDRKALQAGTSHFLGQNFSKASEIKFLDVSGKEEFAWTTSWGVSTRLIGGIIMTHGDDDGIICPPRLAPAHIAILPVIHGDDVKAAVLDYCDSLATELRGVTYDGRPLDVVVDKKEGRGGEKVWGWIKKGIPLYCEIGPRDVAAGAAFIGRRDKSRKERFSLPRAEFVAKVPSILDDIQKGILERARTMRDSNIKKIDSRDEFYSYFTPKNQDKPEVHGGFALCHWNGNPKVEEQVRNDLSVTIRCIPLDAPEEPGKCVISGEPSARRVIFAKSY